MGQAKIVSGTTARASVGTLLAAVLLLALTASAQATPFHTRTSSLDVTGLNHACGTAVDSKGDFYASSAGESKVKVYNPSHTLLTEISEANTPCGLALTTTGNLYVSERATGDVVRFKPNKYPFEGTPVYGSREVIDASGKAKGIAVDPADNRLYVAEGERVSVYDSEGALFAPNEVQAVSISGTTGGTFKLEFEGQKTAAVAFSASAAELKAALEALSTIGAGNVEVAKPSQFSVTFIGKFAHTSVPLMVPDGTSLTGTKPKITVSETTKGFGGHIGEGTLTEASGVAAYTNTSGAVTDRYLWIADAKGLQADRLYLFGGTDVRTLALRREVTGAATPAGSFGFGAAGAYLAADPGNRNSKGECKVVGAQACTAGHLFLYDAAHKALDEFDATGEFLDRTANAAFADAEPSAVAIDRSGGANDGTLYVTAGAGAGAKALAFSPLKAPSRETLGEPLSHILANARAVATDSHGDVYAAAGSEIRVYGHSGEQLAKIEDPLKPKDLAVDSACNLYVLDEGKEGFSVENEVNYYAPSKCPPDSKTTYSSHGSPIATPEEFPVEKKLLRAIAVDPGPGPSKDHLFVTSNGAVHEYDSAANGSGALNEEFASSVPGVTHLSIAVDGVRGTVYIAVNPSLVYAVSEETGEILRRFETGSSTQVGANPLLAVDQADGHVVEYDQTSHARELDAAGAFVAEFGSFTEAPRDYRVAIDSSCAIHEPPLAGKACEEFDPANGTVYVGYDDPSPSHPPYDVTAFGPLKYPAPAKHKLTVEKKGTGSGEVKSSPAGIECGSKCSAEFEETEVVTLKVKADEGSEFIKWLGCEAEPSATECEVTMSEDRTVTAEFKEKEGVTQYPLTVKKIGVGKGTVTSTSEKIDCDPECSEETAEFSKGSSVTLTAKAAKGSEFAGWSGCEAEPSPTECEVKMTGIKEVEVNFDIEHPTLTVNKEGTGTGIVTSEEPGIDCGSTCSAQFNLNEEVTLTAEADEGSKFDGWSGGDCEAETVSPTEGTCEVTMSEPIEVTATFGAHLQVRADHAHPILYDEATLRGEIDTAELQTEYRFDYLTEQEYEENGETFEGAKHSPMNELASGTTGFASVEAPLVGLEEGTQYRFRLIAQNTSPETVEDEGTFETLQRRNSSSCLNAEYRFGLSANLPDCRAYELVTPAQTDGLTPYAAAHGTSPSLAFNNWLTVQSGAGAGDSISYFTDGTLPGFEGNGILDGYRAERGPGEHPAGGWQSALFSPGYAESAPGIHASPLQLGIAPDQQYSAWEFNPEPETFPQTLAHGTYLRTPTGFEVLGEGSLGKDLGALDRYVSAGGAHLIFTSEEHLEGKAAPKGTVAIYDRTAGEASATVVSLKPDGSPFGAGEDATYVATTEDGSAVVFSVNGMLYLHRAGTTTEIATSPSTFAGISEDGTRVFYAATASGASPAALFACDAKAGPCTGPGAHSPQEIASAGIFAGVSPDGSHAFFSSTEALTGGEENDNGEKADEGEHNLYTWDGTGVRFIAKLSPVDFQQFAGFAEMNLGAWTKAISLTQQSGRAHAPIRSTQGGGVFVFQSHARITTYDNKGMGEIYRYDPAAEAGERLLCVSCDPTGALPSADALLEDVGDASPLKPTTMIASLSSDGREVFFQSFDRLVPEDANEAEDVYEWTAKGAGGCGRSGGCLALISSGQGETPSFLYAMSANGHDVFLQTKEKLVGADVAGSPSIYDAREEGGIPELAEPAPCQGDACQRQGSEPPVLPGLATTGAGESPEAPSPPRCGKGKHRVKGRCVAVKHKHRGRRHRRAHANRGGNR
jgi:hypothetical protein